MRRRGEDAIDQLFLLSFVRLRLFISFSQCVKFHPNSLYLATGSADRTCRLWDIQRGACVRLFVGHHDNAVSSLAISPDGRYLASAGESLLPLSRPFLLRGPPVSLSRPNASSPNPSLTPFLPSLSYLAAEDYTINLWDLGSSRLIKKMSGHTSTINSLAFSSESALLVSGSADCTVRVWDVKSAETEGTIVSLNGGSGTGAGVGGTKAGEGKENEKEKNVPGPVVGGVGTEKGELPMGMGLGKKEGGVGGREVTMRKGILGGMERRW